MFLIDLTILSLHKFSIFKQMCYVYFQSITCFKCLYSCDKPFLKVFYGYLCLENSFLSSFSLFM